MSKVLVFGKSGQLGVRLCELLGENVIASGREDVDLMNIAALKQYLNNLKETPTAIIDAAAYTQVDKAESDGKDENYILNRDVPIILATYCKQKDIPFIYYTTDYVFDGKGDKPFDENNTVNLKPLNEYGKAKLEAENKIREVGGKYLIFRTSWTFNEVGRNFVKTMLAIGKDRDELSVVSDQVGSPTYTLDLAHHTIEALKKANSMSNFPSGIYHLTNSGFTSWYDFANKIFELSKTKWVNLKIKKVNPISSSEYPTPAKRGLNSRLSKDKIRQVFGIKPRAWEDALKECLDNLLKEELN